MVAYRYDPAHIAPANAAPRCQHIRINGRRCGAPARRRRRYCRFHEHVLLFRKFDYKVRIVEDATTLQFALMEVTRLLDGPRPDYRACGLRLYALQIACSNMKAFREEQVETEGDEAQPAATQSVASQNDGASAGESLAALLRRLRELDNAEAPAPASPGASAPPAAGTPAKFPPVSQKPNPEAERSRVAHNSQSSPSASCRIENHLARHT
ncbi:MAG: hypothetical protein WA188_18245 [Terriglobales bacterium]